jgi:hypothetical protein
MKIILCTTISIIKKTWGYHSVAYLLKARTVEPEKQLLLVMALKQHSFLGNGRETDENDVRCKAADSQ